ncbi:hypothetical protein AURDEDRAFT_55717 [Auricularia subglabra TFB-10046 SS5]|nr:hypothetical protein AURDEDRAFT_55717 [Auricularia subglabra TFB-10046 SS5]
MSRTSPPSSSPTSPTFSTWPPSRPAFFSSSPSSQSSRSRASSTSRPSLRQRSASRRQPSPRSCSRPRPRAPPITAPSRHPTTTPSRSPAQSRPCPASRAPPKTAIARPRSSPRRRRRSTLIPCVAAVYFLIRLPYNSFLQSWAEIWRRLRRVLPYLWPWRNYKLQLLAFICALLVALGRVINLGIPFSLGATVARLETWAIPDPTKHLSPWWPLLVYVSLRFLSNAVSTVEEVLWQPVMQYSDREMAQLSFNHILNLSLRFHTHRKTGEVLRILDRGSAINHVFELLLFFIAPTFLDITIGLIAFYIKFEATLALVICAVFVAYITASITLTGARTKLRRRMNDADVVTRGIHTDCLLNYETVKYFGNEAHEQERYREAVLKYQSFEFKVMAYLNLLNIVQNSIISLGLLVGSTIVALRVTRGEAKSSDFIVFITYLAQLYGPLNQLGYIYRSLNSSLVDTEKLLKLLDEPVDVNDRPGAPDLVVSNGEIEFDNVNFSYDGLTPALRGVSFKIAKGSSVALVGQTGSGKSTALRLLYRFYDLAPGQGRILVDGQDIRDVTQVSLRKAVGVVPQDSVLFNSTIEYNIKYGKLDASAEEVVAAAKAAQMHDRILSFPDGYQTTVGERGVRLSGGEKQRVAIARTLLKNPPILLLDEATSALDTTTERDIQNALQNLMQGRSSLSIAHRLSTIAAADLILVLKDGQIIEQGNIRELIALNGEFAAMWAEQVKTDEDAQLLASVSGDTKETAHAPASVKEEPTSGYILDEPLPAEAEAVAQILPSAAIEAEQEREAADAVPVPGSQVPDGPVSDEPVATEDARAPEQPQDAHAAEAPAPAIDAEPTPAVAFPSSSGDGPAFGGDVPFVSSPPEIESSAPIGFPVTADDASSRREGSFSARPAGHGAAISFGPEVDRPPSRVGTPDVEESQQKRKRTASQNLQNLSKFAKRMSLGRRQSASVSSPTDAGATTPTKTPAAAQVDTPVSPSPAASFDDSSASGTGSPRGSKLLKRKETTAKEDKPPARRRTTLSFSRPKAPKPPSESQS